MSTPEQQEKMTLLFDAIRNELLAYQCGNPITDDFTAFERVVHTDDRKYSAKQDAYAVWLNDHTTGTALFWRYDGEKEVFPGQLPASPELLELVFSITSRLIKLGI